MSVGLNGLLEGPHLLDFNELSTPLLVNYIALITFQLKLFRQPPLNLSQVKEEANCRSFLSASAS